jgi:hypothetical protein
MKAGDPGVFPGDGSSMFDVPAEAESHHYGQPKHVANCEAHENTGRETESRGQRTDDRGQVGDFGFSILDFGLRARKKAISS